MKVTKRVSADSKFQYSLTWWIEQIVMVIIALVVCLVGSINFV